MRLTLVAVGRMPTDPKNPERALFDHYRGRLQWPFAIKEVEDKKKRSGADLKRAEADLLKSVIPDGSVIVALDERGKGLSSRDFAEKLGAWRDDGIRDIAFLIGGADGLDPSIRKAADLVMNFGALTWPHMLVRGLLAEQLFRAQCILSGHPYHRD